MAAMLAERDAGASGSASAAPELGGAARQQRAPAFVAGLGEHGAALAVVAGDQRLSYAALDALVDRTAARLGAGRRLVAIAAANTIPSLVGYLAALRAGHVVLMAPPCRLQDLAETYGVDTIVAGTADSDLHLGSQPDAGTSGAVPPDFVTTAGTVPAHGITLRRRLPAHALHPELALLLSTSGTTGNPKLVRLSSRNLEANASGIAQALELCATDRAITTLSPAYSYGLSVVNSHLAVGATLVLTDVSVTEPAFWQVARRERITTLAGVPYTFELLDAVGFSGAELPSLRLMTCAGGRLPARTASRYAALGAANGWMLSLMYGQTEATARMAVQPGTLTAAHPDCVGHPLPGGAFRIAEPGPDGTGSLVYRGPNVMMGYAAAPADLARAAELDELVTGDRARITEHGLLRIVGRAGTFAKVFGLRIDLDDLDRALTRAGSEAVTVPLESGIGVALARSRRAGAPPGEAPGSATRGTGSGVVDLRERMVGVVCEATKLPPGAVTVTVVDELPRTHSGKVDRAAAAALFPAPGAVVTALVGGWSPGPDAPERQAPAATATRQQEAARELQTTFAELLGKPVTTPDSFRSVGGDSLSYVAASVAVERVCGQLPRRWHERPIDELAALAAADHDDAERPAAERAPAAQAGGSAARPGSLRTRLRSRQLETTVLLRAVAIVLIVGSHAHAMDVRGGAHVLIALAGYNLARFSLSQTDLRRRTRRIARSAAEMLVPAMLWVTVLAAVTTSYSWNILGTNWLANPTTENSDWRYWFVESLLWILPVVAMVIRVPAVERFRRRHPFALPAVATVVAWCAYQLTVPDVRPIELFSPPAVLWLFLLGWTVAEACTSRDRLVVSALVLALVPWSFASSRAIVVPVAILLVIWADRIRLPGGAAAATAVLAEASLFIYLSHWQVLEVLDGVAALLVALPVGIAIQRAVTLARRRLRPIPAPDRPPAPEPQPSPEPAERAPLSGIGRDLPQARRPALRQGRAARRSRRILPGGSPA